MNYGYSIDESDGYLIMNPLTYKYDELYDNYQLDDTDDIILPFNVKNVIITINYTYINAEYIVKQFKLDMMRTSIYNIELNDNNERCINKISHNKLYNLINTKFNLINTKFNLINTKYNLINTKYNIENARYLDFSFTDVLLCLTQSIFFWPYKIIHYKYCHDNIHLGELSSNHKNKKNYIEYIDLNDNCLQFIIYKQLRLFIINDFGDDETLKIINIEIHLSFGDDNVSLLKIF
jgi:hypothetical protein